MIYYSVKVTLIQVFSTKTDIKVCFNTENTIKVCLNIKHTLSLIQHTTDTKNHLQHKQTLKISLQVNIWEKSKTAGHKGSRQYLELFKYIQRKKNIDIYTQPMWTISISAEYESWLAGVWPQQNLVDVHPWYLSCLEEIAGTQGHHGYSVSESRDKQYSHWC